MWGKLTLPQIMKRQISGPDDQEDQALNAGGSAGSSSDRTNKEPTLVNDPSERVAEAACTR